MIGCNFATCVSADVFVAHLVLLLWGLGSVSELGESIFRVANVNGLGRLLCFLDTRFTIPSVIKVKTKT